MNSIVWSFPMISPLHSTSSLKYNRTNSKTKGCWIFLMSKWTAKWISLHSYHYTTIPSDMYTKPGWILHADNMLFVTLVFFPFCVFIWSSRQKEVCYWDMKSPVEKHFLYLAALHSICLKRKPCAVFWRLPCYASAISYPKI